MLGLRSELLLRDLLLSLGAKFDPELIVRSARGLP
jgi:hypothetical protein